jgi:hypothetical protein
MATHNAPWQAERKNKTSRDSLSSGGCESGSPALDMMRGKTGRLL